MMIKVNNAQSKKSHTDNENAEFKPKLSDFTGIPSTIASIILEKNWQRLFAGMVIIDIAYIDGSLVVFDMNFLARMKGKRICARKEPDYF